MSASIRLRSVPSLLLALTLGVSNAAAWSNSANLNNPIATGAGDQISPHVLADGAGGMFVNWSSTPNGVNYHGYVQRLDPSGAPLWGAGGVLVSAAAGDQLASVMVSDGAGGMIVCWYDTRAGNLDLYAQHYNSAGIPQWVANGVAVVAFAGNQQIGSMISDGAGGVIVAWIDDRTDPSYDVYARRVTAAGVPQWTANGTPICTVAGLQGYPEMVSDGAGGAIITWPDERAGAANSDIYAQRVNGAGTVQWAANGIPVCAAVNNQYGAFAVVDGAGGAFINWYDYRGGAIPHLYGQHLNPSGSIQWAADGRQITFGSQEIGEVGVADGSGGEYVIWDDYSHPNEPDIYAQHLNAAGLGQWGAGGSPVIDLPGSQVLMDYGPDGQGGLIVVFRDVRDGSEDLYIQRIAPNGIPQWGPSTGVALSVAPGDQDVARMAPDGAGGFVIAFEDHRNSPTTDIYAQRIHFFGQLGSPEPKIVSVKDVANDQGGQVRVSWNASYLDGGPGTLCTEYRVWRKVPTALAQARIRRGETFRITGTAAIEDFWELADSQPANGYPSYSLVAATTGDSVGGSNPRTQFLVEARHAPTSQHWDSQPDSGYSVDNLGPPTPAPFTGNYASGSAYLTWGASPAGDLSNYRLYRGVTSSFVPAIGNRIASPTQASFTDPAGAPYWYKLSAVDVHGNESGFATLLPTGTTDVAGAPRELRIDPPSPNPSRGAIAFRVGLPAAARVGVELFDQQGRRVGAIAERAMEAGERELTWNGLGEDGRPIASGLYFYQVRVGMQTWNGRIALVR